MKFFTQALCWEYYNKLKNCEGIHFIKDPNFELEIRKIFKMVRIWSFFLQILMHHNFLQTNTIQ